MRRRPGGGLTDQVPFQEILRAKAEDLLKTGRFLYLDPDVTMPSRKLGDLVAVLADTYEITQLRVRRYLFAARFSPLEAHQWFRDTCGKDGPIPVLLGAGPTAKSKKAARRGSVATVFREVAAGAFGKHAH